MRFVESECTEIIVFQFMVLVCMYINACMFTGLEIFIYLFPFVQYVTPHKPASAALTQAVLNLGNMACINVDRTYHVLKTNEQMRPIDAGQTNRCGQLTLVKRTMFLKAVD